MPEAVIKGRPDLLSVTYTTLSTLNIFHRPHLWSESLSFLLCKMSIPCEARCGRWFTSISSRNSHLSKARSCVWFEKEKLRALGLEDDEDIPAPLLPQEDEDDGQWVPVDEMEFGPYEDEFRYLPTEEPEAGPGPHNQILEGAANTNHPVLEDDEDQRVVQVDEEAGRIYRRDPPPKHCQVDKDGDSLMDNNGEPNPFIPFASELDWRVAQWAVRDGPGHNAFNRLLDIPGVRNSN
jgi:hypothetical protein